MDLVCLRKISWKGLDWLLQGLRIDREFLSSMTEEEIRTLRRVYKHKRVKGFLAGMCRELNHD